MKRKTIQETAFGVLKNSIIFQGISDELIRKTVEDDLFTYHTVPAGETILEPRMFKTGLLFILEGRATVKKHDENNSGTLLSILTAGSISGAVTVFSDAKEYVTFVRAQTECTYAMLPTELIRRLFREDVAVAENYIRYLSKRIYYLNEKIGRFTENSAEARLADYLSSLAGNTDDDLITLPVSISDLASALAVGRASLYRAFDALEQSGIIEKQGRKIRICDSERLIHYGI